MTRPTSLLVPHQVLTEIRSTPLAHGSLGLTRYGNDDVFAVTQWATSFTSNVTFRQPLRLTATSDTGYVATWHRTDEQTQYTHWKLSRSADKAISLDGFRRLVPTFTLHGGTSNIVLTHAPELESMPPDHPLAEFAAWLVNDDAAHPFPVHLEPPAHGIEQLATRWPVSTLQSRRVLVVGCGSLGGVVADSLAGYGVGALALVDPDRLLWHNTVRHLLGDEHIGRFKVDALDSHLSAGWPRTEVVPLAWDVVSDADRLRALVADVNLVVCTADTIAARRVTSHLSARAVRDVVFTSVLEEGAYGEVIRQRPRTDHGCLLCRRAQSYSAGEMDPERALERGYGDGQPHRPMTAVGPDLALVGRLAAKVAVASLLDRAGHSDQRLPGEQAIVSLRPVPGFAAPFDSNRTCEVQWFGAAPPRPECITCQPP